MIHSEAIHSKAIRAAARGQPCTLNIAGVCNYDPSTTVLCHLPDESHGMNRKSDDLSAAFGCSDCHDVIDGRRPHLFRPGDKDWYTRRAMVRTWRILVREGVIQIKGVKSNG